jgi:hypothetical protein
MPKAFSLTYGLDLETEMASFWTWFRDARDAVDGRPEATRHVRDLVEREKPTIARLAAKESDPEMARFSLMLAVAMVGSHYASNQKLLAALQDYGLLRGPDESPIFDTIVEPSLEEERPR